MVLRQLQNLGNGLFGRPQEAGGTLANGGNYAVSDQVAGIGDGVGKPITPDNNITKGLYIDGGLIEEAEAQNLEITPYMAGRAKELAQKMRETKRWAKEYFRSVESISNDSVSIVNDYSRAKSTVVQNHLRQHQAHNRYLSSADRAALGYKFEQERRKKDKQEMEQKFQAWQSKVNARSSRYV